MTTLRANEIAREVLLKMIVAKLQKGVKRRFGCGLSPNMMWRGIHK